MTASNETETKTRDNTIKSKTGWVICEELKDGTLEINGNSVMDDHFVAKTALDFINHNYKPTKFVLRKAVLKVEE